MAKSPIFWLLAGGFALTCQAQAQDATEAQALEPIAQSEAEPTAAESGEEATGDDETVIVNPDEMAEMLNSSQQLQQTFTLRRTVNGEVVATEKRTVTYSRDEPYRETEAGRTTVERLKSSFDGEALTRTEAFEEAKIDFVIADLDRDELLTASEFAGLVESWRNNSARQADAPNAEIARQRQYDAFLAEIDPRVAKQQNEAYAREKFAFMAGASSTMTLLDYIREYMLDFDSMDADKDAVLTGDELMRFRALNRGETLDM